MTYNFRYNVQNSVEDKLIFWHDIDKCSDTIIQVCACYVAVVGSFQPSYEMMLTFYGLYKQATNGRCTSSRPYMWDVVGRAKWYRTIFIFTVRAYCL